MPELKQKIKENIQAAMKSGDETVVSTLRMLLSSILNKEIAGKKDKSLNDEEIVEIIFSEAKKRKESIEQFRKGQREDLAKKEEAELEILKKYLPEQMSEEEVKKIVKAGVEKVGAETIKDMGKVMAEVSPKVKGKAEGGLVSKIVKEFLAAK